MENINAINTNEFMKDYSNIVLDLDKIRKRQEDLLTDIVKKYQKSEEGIDIKDLGVSVDLDGYEKHLVYAIRTVSDDDMDDFLELKIVTVDPNEYEWLSIYDFYAGTAGEILSEIMENL
jgi:hypothetical protein